MKSDRSDGENSKSSKRFSVTILDDAEEAPIAHKTSNTSAGDVVVGSRTTSTFRRGSEAGDTTSPGSLAHPSPKSFMSEGSSRSNLEKLKVPWDTRSGASVVEFHDTAPTKDYTMDEELGVGGFGTVYKGTSKTGKNEVAIKIILRERLHSEDNFQDELKVARKLAHPNIVRLYASYEDLQTGFPFLVAILIFLVWSVGCKIVTNLENTYTCIHRQPHFSTKAHDVLCMPRRCSASRLVLQDSTSYYLVMEFCPGGTLSKFVGTKTMTKDDLGLWTVGLDAELFARYAWQMLSGAAYLHHHKIAHRDIKLENYMRISDDEDADLKLIDMGLACRFKSKERMSEVVGTVLTMAPEVRSKDYDEKVDVWGIGMVLYMCAVCMDPWYNSKDYSAMEEDEILAALDDPNLQLNYHEKRWSLKPKEVKDLVESLLVINPNNRPRARQVMASNKWLIANGSSTAKRSEEILNI